MYYELRGDIMKISTKVECGIIALVDICINSGNDEVVTVINISRRQDISAKYLEQILPLLRHAGIIRSVKGAKGGYTLTAPADQITLREVIDALDSGVLEDVNFRDPRRFPYSRCGIGMSVEQNDGLSPAFLRKRNAQGHYRPL